MTYKTKGKPTDADKVIGARLRAARKHKGASQSDLSLHLGITFQQIQKYEKGINRISCSRLIGIASYFDLPVWWFFPEQTHDKFARFVLRVKHVFKPLPKCAK